VKSANSVKSARSNCSRSESEEPFPAPLGELFNDILCPLPPPPPPRGRRPAVLSLSLSVSVRAPSVSRKRSCSARLRWAGR
jgi:hypothetical protein